MSESSETWAYTHWQGRWFCPCCERIFRKVTTRAEDGSAWHSWKCREQMRHVDVTITPAPTTNPQQPELRERQESDDE